MELIRGIFGLLIMALLIYGLVIIGLALLPVILLVAGVAFIWYFIKFYRIRKELEKAMREHREAGGLHEAHYRETNQQSGETIEVDYYEIKEEEPADKKD